MSGTERIEAVDVPECDVVLFGTSIRLQCSRDSCGYVLRYDSDDINIWMRASRAWGLGTSDDSCLAKLWKGGVQIVGPRIEDGSPQDALNAIQNVINSL